MRAACPPVGGDDWIDLREGALPVADATSWAVVPGCGAVVSFVGTVRDHADGREGVSGLEYEAYEEPALERLGAVAGEARRRWPRMGRLAIIHRIGSLELCEAAVVVVVSAPHRGEAFEAARWCIDTVKETVPIWKKEQWADGADWGTGATPISDSIRSA